MELTKQHISEKRLQWLIDGLDLKAWILGPKAQDCFEKALLELKQRRAEDRQRESNNGKE